MIITRDYFCKVESAHFISKEYDESLIRSINVIIQNLFKIFDIKVIDWKFRDSKDTEDPEDKNFWANYYSDHVNNIIITIEDCDIETYCTLRDKVCFIDKYGHQFNWDGKIPIYWFFENYELEIYDGIKKLEEDKKKSIAYQKSLKQKAKEDRKRMLLSIKGKLTFEEINLLKKNVKDL